MRVSGSPGAFLDNVSHAEKSTGNQKVPPKGDTSFLKPGISITDACISWQDTEAVLQILADAVKQRKLLPNDHINDHSEDHLNGHTNGYTNGYR